MFCMSGAESEAGCCGGRVWVLSVVRYHLPVTHVFIARYKAMHYKYNRNIFVDFFFIRWGFKII